LKRYQLHNNSWHSACTRGCRTYWETFKQLGCLHFYTLQFVYNSQPLVFYSTQSHVTVYGNATNWTSTGWEEIYPQQSK